MTSEEIEALVLENRRMWEFVMAYARKMQVGTAGMTDDEIAAFELAWRNARKILETTNDQ